MKRCPVPQRWLLGLLVAVGLVGGGFGGTITAGATLQESVPFDISEWKTDFTKHSVPLSEIMSGGPPKDGIPAIDRPEFIPVPGPDDWLKPQEPVIFFEHAGDARAYPLQILIWHEIVNDTVGGAPVAITFCPLCHTAIAFDRRAGGKVLDFGTTGKLRFSDLVMYDRQTESWWQQASGEAIVGMLTGVTLTPLPAQIISWATFKQAFPRGKVLSRQTGFRRAYGRNPYVGYDDINASPFLYRGPSDPRLRPMERVVTVSIRADAVAYPFRVLERVRVINDTVGGVDIVVLFERGVTSALDRSEIASSRDIGTEGVFERALNRRVLRFEMVDGRVIDTATRSIWTILGTARAGPLKGIRLAPVVHGQYFWFSWAVFQPKTRVYSLP
jgi:hypothetical protein